MDLSEEVKRMLITADTFSLKNDHPQLTPSVVLTFILEEFSDRYKNKIDKFFIIKHRALAKALRQEDGDDSGERYSNDLVMCLYKCKTGGSKKIELDDFTKHLIDTQI